MNRDFSTLTIVIDAVLKLIELYDIIPKFEDYRVEFFNLLNSMLNFWSNFECTIEETLSMFMVYHKNLFENVNLNLKLDCKLSFFQSFRILNFLFFFEMITGSLTLRTL